MDIHAPHGPVTTWREIATHLAIVTVGILIALGLEGLVEWHHHRKLVEEARANLSVEIRENRAELEHCLADIPKTEETVGNLTQELANAAREKSKGQLNMRYAFNDAELSDASWITAQTTGAVGYMSYSEVKRYAELYALQRLFVETQRETIDRIIDSSADMNVDTNAFAVAQRMSAVDRSLHGLEQVGKSLDKRYQAF